MKIKPLYLAVLALLVPVSSYSMGIGDIKLESHLNEPFKAEIPILDLDGVPLSGIKASLASPEDYERIGLEPSGTLAQLNFKIQKNNRGQEVIDVRSVDRISEPYLQLVVDLAWSKGQLYRAYTVLLDPPDYSALTTRRETFKRKVYLPKNDLTENTHSLAYKSVAYKPTASNVSHSESTYGPTNSNDDIWQIAQRYATEDASLPQVVLAIVGTNSQAFTQGNLNGMKMGEQLRIPSDEEILKVPLELAKKEIVAQNYAWKTNTEIKHVLLPPYINGMPGITQFSTQSDVNQANVGNADANQAASVQSPPQVEDEKPTVTQVNEVPQKVLAQEDKSAISQINTGNTAKDTQLASLDPKQQELQQQMQLLQSTIQDHANQIAAIQKENTTISFQLKQLQQQMGELENLLTAKTKEHDAIKNQQQVVVASPAPESTPKVENTTVSKVESTSTPVSKEDVNTAQESQQNNSFWLYLIGFGGILGLLALIHKMRSKDDLSDYINDEDESDYSTDNQLVDENPPMREPYSYAPPAETDIPVQAVQVEQPVVESMSQTLPEDIYKYHAPVEPFQQSAISFDDAKASLSPVVEKIVEAEVPVATHIQSCVIETPQLHTQQTEKLPEPAVLQHQNLPTQKTPTFLDKYLETQTPKLVKSKAALDTLLSLSKTYISMGDFKTAKQSLQEVMDFGDDKQKSDALRFLDEIAAKL